jgi:hypothetical protein
MAPIHPPRVTISGPSCIYICKCFRCFHLYVASVYLDVCMVCNGYTRVFKFFLVFCKCFRYMLQMFQLFSDLCCECFICCKSRSWCCTCCNRTHLPHPPAAVVEGATVGHRFIMRVPKTSRRIRDVASTCGACEWDPRVPACGRSGQAEQGPRGVVRENRQCRLLSCAARPSREGPEAFDILGGSRRSGTSNAH